MLLPVRTISASILVGLVMAMAGTLLGATSIYDFTMASIDGKPTPLASFKGKIVLMVNVASQCGYTYQYKGLEAIYEKYKDRGFVVLGFPANNFGEQEPGTNAEIKTFCESKYFVKFPMFAKISVAGRDQHPLYAYLTKQTDRSVAGEIRWNFTKFLVDRNGRVVRRFEPEVEPDSRQVIDAIEAELKR